jgi:hypothetical protein
MWGGLSVASLGDQVCAVVLSWTGAALLGTNSGYLAATQAMGMLLVALLSGAWADRVEHRRMMIVADLLRCATLATVAVVWTIADGPVAWTLFAGAFLMMAGIGLYRPAMQTVVPGIVRQPEDLPATNALIDTSERLARLLGPTIVSMASLAASLTSFIACAAAGFAISAASTWAILQHAPARLAAANRPGLIEAVSTGFRVLRPQPLLWFMLWVNMIINGAWFGAFFVGLPLIVERSGAAVPGGGNGGLAAYGLVMAAYGGANLLSTLMMGSLGVRGMSARMIFRGNYLLGGGIAVMGLAGSFASGAWLFPLLFLGSAISAIGGPMQDITVATMRQIQVPRRDMGAAVRAFMLVNQTGSLIAMLAAPSAFERIGIAPAVMVCGAAIIVVAMIGMRKFGSLAGSG